MLRLFLPVAGMRKFRASELGSCLTRQVHKQLGSTALDPPPTLQAAFDRGNVHEEACVAEMRAQGWKVRGEQDVIGYGGRSMGVLPFANDNDVAAYLEAMRHSSAWLLTGHLDGRCNLPSDYPATRPRVLEIKAPNAWAKFERAYKTDCWDDQLARLYAYQVSTYQVATGLEAVVACLWPRTWTCTSCGDVYTYDSNRCQKPDDGAMEPNWDDAQLKWFVIETPILPEPAIIARCEEINRLANLGVVPADCEAGLRDDWSCPYRHLHGAPERPEQEDGELDRLVGLYGGEKALRDAADARMKQYREEIDLHLGLDDTRETANSIATRVTTSRRTLDKAAVRAAGIDLVPFERQSVSTSIRVTVKGNSEVDSPS